MDTTIQATAPTRSAKETKLNDFINKILHPVWFRLFLLWKLPMGIITGMRVRSLDIHHCHVTVPYKYLNQNPFKSTYFAVLGMAAEMSAGVLSMLAAESQDVPVSTLVVGLKADFVKKATQVTTFKCEDGDAIFRAVEESVRTGEGQVVDAVSVGRDPEGNEIARFTISWSFKPKSRKS